MKKVIPMLLLGGLVLTGCQTVGQHRSAVDQASQGVGEQRLTIGTVQAGLRKGMSGGEVATVMGSPNIVSTDANGNEVWIYDRISTESNYSSSSSSVGGGVGAGAPVGVGILGGIFGGSASQSAGASSTSQKTMTVIVKFDDKRMVRDIAYHTSRF